MDTINGLPAHPLLVHVVVVMIPLAALAAIVSAVWPRARVWLGPTPAILSLIALIFLPLVTSAGESLEHSLGVVPTGPLADHVEWGDKVILLVGPLFGLTALWWLLTSDRVSALRGRYLGDGAAKWVRSAVAVLTVIVALGSLAITIRVGDLGAQSVWGGR
ncbi:hypothetical protein HH308_17305 [Gordonia sp. TBRC 11910]|uniref:Uncharacterized protein n=1 Tax=Gordonia asplenii TaxID=2725283 RepID=A0A848KXK4_9ACTN|nr:DUF2231 domain-containing protein [Gordonia asplenii]NMO02972.1 hypothetical protein [Gordonia asplenii]